MAKLNGTVKYMQQQYWKTLGIKPVSNKAVSVDPDNSSMLLLHDKQLERHNYVLIKYLPLDLNIAKAYRKGILDSYTQTAEIKNFHELLFMSRSDLGHLGTGYTHWYKVLITGDNRAYGYHGRFYVDRSGQSAYQNYSKYLKKFKSHVMNTKAGKYNQTIVHALRLRNQVYRQLHVHGLISSHSTDNRKMSSDWSEWLSDKLGYQVTVRVTPLRDYALGTNTEIISDDRKRKLPAIVTSNIQQWLKYINRSYSLAFPNFKHPEKLVGKWQKLGARERRTYVVDTLINRKGVTCSFNYSYTRKIKALTKAIHERRRAEQADRKHEQAIDRWASHHKHLTSIEQWKSAQGKSVSTSEPTAEQTSLDLSEPEVNPETQIMTVRAVLSELLISIHKSTNNRLEATSQKLNQTYIYIDYEDGSRVVNHSGIPP